MKRKFLVPLIAILIALPAITKAQGPVIYKDWEMIIESTTLMDISYRVIKCDTANQIHLLIFNENSIDQVAHFDLEITNTDNGEKYTKEINFSCTKATVYKALCESDATMDPLKINLPANFNPAGLTVKLTFKP